MINIGIAVDYFSRGLEIERNKGGSYDARGNFDANSGVTAKLNGSIQPMRGRDLNDMPEGIREEARLILSTTGKVENDDTVIDGGTKYRVIYIWPSTLGHYTRAALGLLEND